MREALNGIGIEEFTDFMDNCGKRTVYLLKKTEEELENE